MRDFYQTFIQLCKERGVAPSNVAQEIGLNKSSVSYWKKGAIPKAETLKAIAQYFNVTVDYLTGLDELETTIATVVNSPGKWKTTTDNEKKDDQTAVGESLLYYGEVRELTGEVEELTEEEKEELRDFVQFLLEKRKRKGKGE